MESKRGFWEADMSKADVPLLVTCGYYATGFIDLRTGIRQSVRTYGADRLCSVNHAEKIFATGDHGVKIWKYEGKKEAKTHKTKAGNVHNLESPLCQFAGPLGTRVTSMSFFEKVMAIGFSNGTLRLFSISSPTAANWSRLAKSQRHTDLLSQKKSVTKTIFLSSSLLASSSDDTTIRLWDLTRGISLRSFSLHPSSHRSSKILLGTGPPSYTPQPSSSGLSEEVTDLDSLSSPSHSLLVASIGPSLCIFDRRVPSSDGPSSKLVHKHPITTLCVVSGGHYVVCGDCKGNVVCASMVSGRPNKVWEQDSHMGAVVRIRGRASGMVVSVGKDRFVRVGGVGGVRGGSSSEEEGVRTRFVLVEKKEVRDVVVLGVEDVRFDEAKGDVRDRNEFLVECGVEIFLEEKKKQIFILRVGVKNVKLWTFKSLIVFF